MQTEKDGCISKICFTITFTKHILDYVFQIENIQSDEMSNKKIGTIIGLIIL